MNKIRVLSEHTINKIAAGEVIENPASVVKELVENALDAGATEISVEIRGGGRQLIRITDNGCGMGHDDAVLCFERHATSKLKEVEDLQTIGTMGFRGEAIPSIASISKLTLMTCPKGETIGTLVKVEAGQIKSAASAPCTEGTIFEVRDLFFNVPVRKNFQRSPAYDAQEIQKMLTQLALGYPEIRFRLVSNQETLLSTRSNTLQERIEEVLGKEFAGGLKKVKSHGDIALEGFLGEPAWSRQNRTGQFLFINKRCVFSPLVAYALREGYGPALAPQRHPIYVLHLTLPGTWVDVNVHPQKKEVRLRQEQDLKQILIESVGQILQAPPGEFSIPVSREPFSYPTFTPARFEMQFRETPSSTIEEPSFFPPQQTLKIASRVIATLPGYILSEREGEIALADQHRAHSRIIFEQLLRKQEVAQQPLLIPYTIELSPSEANTLKSYLETFNRLGIGIREFGPYTFTIDALPTSFGNTDVDQLILDLLSKIRDFHDPENFARQKETLIAQAAAKASIGKSKKLSTIEAQALLQRLIECDEPSICPQGKKITVPLRPEEFSKWF